MYYFGGIIYDLSKCTHIRFVDLRWNHRTWSLLWIKNKIKGELYANYKPIYA